ncbi:PilW family protein [Comamonas sp. GB3 AK4-5]|uniref:PilW family protein n=1 Tax=Comamonas sp. GB3 AK4-5 TaxID=3231487 RepID=UPI00351EFB39
MHRAYANHRQQGLSLVELMVAMAIGLWAVWASATVYLHTASLQRAQERRSAAEEAGAFAMGMLGRDILNAGFYPASFASSAVDGSQVGGYDSYPPLESAVRKDSDWQNMAQGWPPLAYRAGIYGCDGGEFNVQTATCPAVDASQPDSLVVNYFSADAMGDGGSRKDCTGSAVDNDPSNKYRSNAGKKLNQPPLQPLFVSNRYALRDLKNFVDQQDVVTKSLACSGNGMSAFGSPGIYQPMVSGFKDMRFRYGVYSGEADSLPERFYSAAEVDAMPVVGIHGQAYTGWQRVSVVKVCILIQSQGGAVRLEDPAGQAMRYLDCDDRPQAQPAGQWVQRLVQLFGVRNALPYSY